MDHRAPDGRFRNPWPTAPRHRFSDFLRWRRQRFLNPPPPPPPAGTLPSATPSFASPRTDAGVLAATWVGHSTVLVQMGGINILT
ncbi:MAG: MBL fold metallo-hydrolase, partial [Gemmatimonadaceae bacterium]